MKTYIFTDQITNEQFIVICEAWQVNSIERINEELSKWVEGRILSRSELTDYQSETYQSLVRLGDSNELALATVLSLKEPADISYAYQN
jgi:hypothetical protein